jgi:hypothetical protein
MTTATALKQSTAPPQPTSQKVRAHRKMLEIERDALRAAGPALSLASALGDLGAKADLAALHAKLAALQFEIDCNDQAVDLARSADAAREASWRAAVQELPAEEIIAGVGPGACPLRCQPGLHCVISGSAKYAGSACSHPVTERHLWRRSEDGAVHYPYEADARSYELYLACCRKLKVSPS